MADELDRLRRLRQLEAEQKAAAEVKAKEDAYYLRDPKTGLSPAQVEAQNALQEAADIREATGLQGKIVTKPGSAGKLSTPPTEGLKPGYEWYVFNLPGGGFEWRQKPTRETLAKAYGADGTGGTGGTGGGPTGPTGTDTTITYTAPDGKIFTDLNSYNAYLAQLESDEKRRTGQSAYDLLFEQFNQFGLGGLVEPLKGFITEGLSQAEFTLRLRDTDAYKKRFAANQARIQKGLRALSEAEYINLEDQYQDVMRRYGLPENYYTRGEMGRQEGFEKFIGGDVSPVELEDRIQTAQRRVINAAPQIKDAISQFYGDEISNGDILAYVLDPAKAIEGIKRKVTAAEIGAGAALAGLGTTRARAEELGALGVTAEQARQGFQAIGGFLPRASQLGDIYAKQGMGPFTQATAEAEVFGTAGAVDAERKRRQLAQLESAQFSGQVGTAGGALGRERAGQF
jgi:hypothetical protein